MRDVLVIGTGMGSLSAAALLTARGLSCEIIEQNWIPGGCTSSYWRKGFVFESGATTLVGLDQSMPLRYILDKTGIHIPVRKLELPMQVHLSNGEVINRYEAIDSWIEECEKKFQGNQRKFWKLAYKISQFVWDASTRFQHFPPARLNDFVALARNARIKDVWYARYAFKSTAQILDEFGIQDKVFRQFVDEQLLITAQNKAEEVNFLFGAAALCYTNYGNYYVDGGLINLVNPFVDYITQNGGAVHFRETVTSIKQTNEGYEVLTNKETYKAKKLISGIPINNLAQIAPDLVVAPQQLMDSPQLYSAFQMGIGFKSSTIPSSLHHQIHLDHPLPETGSDSIFISLSHPEDYSRSDDPGARVLSVSTHLKDPSNRTIQPELIEEAIINVLVNKKFLNKEDIIYRHSSGPKSWNKWTGRSYGFVGGYPQYMHIKPWQMVEARLNRSGAYHCGDTAYPGQGIPGAALSGIIASAKLLQDK